MLANPNAERVPLDGVKRLEAPDEHTYEAWVIQGDELVPAGLFSGGDERATVVPLNAPVPEGAIVAVTVEQAGGVDRTEQQPIITSRAT